MFTIKKKPLTPNIIWDGSAGKPLCNFGHKGTITTNDRELAEKLAALGHEVTGDAEIFTQLDGGNGIMQPEEPAAPGSEVEPEAEQPDEATEIPAPQAADPAAKGSRKRK